MCSGASFFAVLLSAQVVFWIFTYPTNVATANWTTIDENWETLRRQWEYSHAVGAEFQVFAMISLIIAAIARARGQIGQDWRLEGRAWKTPPVLLSDKAILADIRRLVLGWEVHVREPLRTRIGRADNGLFMPGMTAHPLFSIKSLRCQNLASLSAASRAG